MEESDDDDEEDYVKPDDDCAVTSTGEFPHRMHGLCFTVYNSDSKLH